MAHPSSSPRAARFPAIIRGEGLKKGGDHVALDLATSFEARMAWRPKGSLRGPRGISRARTWKKASESPENAPLAT